MDGKCILVKIIEIYLTYDLETLTYKTLYLYNLMLLQKKQTNRNTAVSTIKALCKWDYI